MKPSEKQIGEIAENLESGMRCYYNIKTGQIITILNFDSWLDADESVWEEEINLIEENPKDFYEFVGMDSHESFKIMADFAELLDNKTLQDRLITALNKPKPFSKFKWIIDNSGDYRQKWFDFKKMKYIESVNDQLNCNIDIFKIK